MDIIELIEKIRQNKECEVYEPCGLPRVNGNEVLPDDIKRFYEICGGIRFYFNSEYEFTVVKPNEIVLANPVIVGELCEEDISSKWYIICKDTEDNYITFDASEERNGRCYDSFWDRHGLVGECSIIARNFTELILKLYENEGRGLFWLEDDFETLGDAYDDI